MNDKSIDAIYMENLEQSIIEYLAKVENIPLRNAMDLYYNSKLSNQIEEKKCGIENLDYKYLALDLIENELHSQ